MVQRKWKSHVLTSAVRVHVAGVNRTAVRHCVDQSEGCSTLCWWSRERVTDPRQCHDEPAVHAWDHDHHRYVSWCNACGACGEDKGKDGKAERDNNVEVTLSSSVLDMSVTSFSYVRRDETLPAFHEVKKVEITART